MCVCKGKDPKKGREAFIDKCLLISSYWEDIHYVDSSDFGSMTSLLQE